MHDFFDRLETRPQPARETALFRDLRHVLSLSKSRAAGLRAQLKGVAIDTIQNRAALARVPLRRRADLLAAQHDVPPFGGFVATRLAAAGSVPFASDGLATVQGLARDWFGMGRALYAAGLRKGHLVLNCCPYDLDPLGHAVDDGARAIGAPVIPAGGAETARVSSAAARLRPQIFCGTAERLRALLDHALDVGADLSSIKVAMTTGNVSAGLRSELELRGVAVRQTFALPEVGLIAYQSASSGGLVLNEGVILEIVGEQTDATGTACGEIVVTRINADVPLVRYATGFHSTVVRDYSPCGRTNVVIRPPSPPVMQRVVVDIDHFNEIARHHPNIGRMRLFVRRPRGQDVLHLEVERAHEPSLEARLCETMMRITRLPGTIAFVKPGSLNDDDAPFIDERPLN